jgi:hypothetical protein
VFSKRERHGKTGLPLPGWDASARGDCAAGLTFEPEHPYAGCAMRFAKAILPVLIAVALVTYAMDCSEAATPDQAMQCCKTMPCSPHHSGKNCCDTMPSAHSPFVQPASLNKITVSLVGHTALPVRSVDLAARLTPDTVVAQYHAPPTWPVSLALSPLRV